MWTKRRRKNWRTSDSRCYTRKAERVRWPALRKTARRRIPYLPGKKFYAGFAGLELEPKCELHNARRLLAGQGVDHPKRRRGDQGVGQPEVRVVEQVESLSAELQPILLPKKREELRDSQIHIGEMWTPKRVAATDLQSVYERKCSDCILWVREKLDLVVVGRVGMEAGGDRGLTPRERCPLIRSKAGGAAASIGGERQPRSPCYDPGGLPATDDFIQPTRGIPP